MASVNLVKLGPMVHISRASTNASPESLETVVVLFGWLGAKLPALQKYVAGHHAKFPNSAVLVVMSGPGVFWGVTGATKKQLAPAIEALSGLGCLGTDTGPNSPRRIITHVISNGGAFQAKNLSTLISPPSSSSSISGKPPIATSSTLVFDSCPGTGTFLSTWRFVNQLTRSNPFPIRYTVLLVSGLLYLLYLPVSLLLKLTINKPLNLLHPLRAHRNRADFFPWLAQDTPRVYIYSRSDQIVPWTVVEEHAQEGKSQHGFDVTLERFERTAHVSHMREEPERYFGIIEKAVLR